MCRRLLVALVPVRVLLLSAKHLILAANAAAAVLCRRMPRRDSAQAASALFAPCPTHPHTIDRWDDATGQNLVEQIAAVGDYLLALETYRAAVKRWPKDKITLRNRARVLEWSWRD